MRSDIGELRTFARPLIAAYWLSMLVSMLVAVILLILETRKTNRSV